MENKRLPQLCEDTNCTGCLACVNACSLNALRLSVNDEGFYRPQLDVEKCVRCNLCEKSCPVLNPPAKNNEEHLKVFAAWHKDDSIRSRSTSGGAFTALAEIVLKKGGAVFGAAYTDDLHVKHIEINKRDDLAKLRLSKYAQSCVGDTMKSVRQRLQEDRWVLYVGTPCQVAGLKNFLRRDYDKLILVDFICHGVASNEMLQTYLRWLENKYGKIKHINFRDKRKGWYDSLRVIKTERGNEKVIRGINDNYWVSYNNNNNLQMSCYQCHMQGFPRVSDITVADFWRIGHALPFGHKDEIEKGVSLVAVNNERGRLVMDEAKEHLIQIERSIEEGIAGNKAAVQSSKYPQSRDTIYQDLKVMDYDAFRKKYMRTSMKQDAVKLFREYLPFRFVKFIRLLKQK